MAQAAAKERIQAFEDFIEAYRDNRVAFVRKVLGVEPVKWQLEELDALDRGCLRISVRSGHGVGKTSLLAWVMLHFLIFRTPCKIVATAPSSSQLDDALVPECRLWMREMPDFLQNLLDGSANRIYWKKTPETAFISFRTARDEKPEALQGIHADNVLLVVDEGSGVGEKIYESGQGSMSTEGAITIITSNPTRRSGFFYNTQTKWSGSWRCRKISCFDSPLAKPAFIQEMRERYGVDSPVYAVRVLGEFPAEEADVFIPYYMVSDAVGRDIQVDDHVPIYWGFDVARGGANKSALIKRQGNVILEPPMMMDYKDTSDLVAHIAAEYKMTSHERRPAHIFTDAIGVGGPVADRLRNLNDPGPLPAVDINVGETKSIDPIYGNLRDDIWGRMRHWFESKKVSLPSQGCDDLVSQLTTPLRVINKRTGKVKCEAKEDMLKRGIASPDAADALGLTFAYDGAAMSGLMSRTAWNRSVNANMDESWLLGAA